jgi:cytochrome c-type biogenesis protein CcmE
MTPRKKRLLFVAAGLCAVALAATFVLNAFRSNLVFFFSPSDVAAGKPPHDRAFRLGGMVVKGSVQRGGENGLTVHFVVTDFARNVPVKFTGILPDLFTEGQGVVAQGKLGADGTFIATEVLAKHDEKYMPPEVADALKRAGKAPDAAGPPVANGT